MAVIVIPSTPPKPAVVVEQDPSVLEPSDVLRESQRLAEFDDETKRSAARANLGLQDIDLGTFN